MLLKMTYKFKEKHDFVIIKCSNYTFGLPILFGRFAQKHGENWYAFAKAGIVADVKIQAYYNETWRTLEFAGVNYGNKGIEIYSDKGNKNTKRN